MKTLRLNICFLGYYFSPGHLILCLLPDLQVQELPETWKNLRKIDFNVKHEVVPLQSKIAQLNALINMLLGELTPGDHQNIMTICTIDVHARDVVATLIAQKM
ncbi:dynein heavy chain 17, axonemal-like [Cyanistes caeruleus]|uniref:dynein heavy chain 17, axonemal-like n=1 Tax=Cyanistes caeruleus TaxID=156563 RepID=UPI000CDB9F61|nr:dynein heavy chain 17, axonemal-like [Cyanistes caeruleus]